MKKTLLGLLLFTLSIYATEEVPSQDSATQTQSLTVYQEKWREALQEGYLENLSAVIQSIFLKEIQKNAILLQQSNIKASIAIEVNSKKYALNENHPLLPGDAYINIIQPCHIQEVTIQYPNESDPVIYTLTPPLALTEGKEKGIVNHRDIHYNPDIKISRSSENKNQITVTTEKTMLDTLLYGDITIAENCKYFSYGNTIYSTSHTTQLPDATDSIDMNDNPLIIAIHCLLNKPESLNITLSEKNPLSQNTKTLMFSLADLESGNFKTILYKKKHPDSEIRITKISTENNPLEFARTPFYSSPLKTNTMLYLNLISKTYNTSIKHFDLKDLPLLKETQKE
jgi:hypothetical protein